MTFMDTLKLAFSNLGQAKLRTILTVSGVAVGIGALSCMVSFGVGVEDQLVSRLTGSGMFDSIMVTSAQFPGRGAGRGRRTAPARGGERGAAPAGRGAAAPADTPDTTGADASAETPRLRLDDEAIAKIAALPNVKSVLPDLRVPVQVSYKEFQEMTFAMGVPLSSAHEGGFQTFAAGSFFANETDDACMLSLDFAKRVTTEKIAPVLLLKMTPCKSTERYASKKSERRETAVTRTDHIARRAESACAIVTPSAYSRSPPTGNPRAMRETVR